MTQIISSKWWGGWVWLYKFKWSVQTYNDLPTSWMKVWDVYNVVEKHSTTPKFPAWSNLAWTGTAWDVLGWDFDLSDYQEKLVEWTWIDIDQTTNVISVEDSIVNWAAAWATAIQPWDNVSCLVNDAGYAKSCDLATVATSWEYCDLSGTPSIWDWTVTVCRNWVCVNSFTLNQSSCSWIDITVPTNTSDLNNDSGYIDNTVNDLQNYTLSSNLCNVATSWQYCDLTGTPNLCAVATSGKYCDLSWTPTIWDATLQIQKNWTCVWEFSANATTNKCINISVPTDNCQLSNGCGYAKANTLCTVATSGKYCDLTDTPNLCAVATSWKYCDLSWTPTIPTDNCELANGCWYAVASSLCAVATTWAYSDLSGTPALCTVATSWKYCDLSGLPTIPTDNCQLANWCWYTTCTWTLVASDLNPYAKSCDLCTVATTWAYSDLSGKPNLCAVATSWKYCDLTWTPTIPTDNCQLANGCGYTTCTWTLVAWDLAPYAKSCDLCTIATSWLYCDISWTPNLCTVATSWKYCDLTGTPALCTVATTWKYCDLSGLPTIPTNNNQLTNGCWYTTCTWTLVASDLTPYAKCCDLKTVATSWCYCDLSWTPTIPSVINSLTSSCTWDSLSAKQWCVLNSCVTDINNKIPSAATSSNQLADKAFVNSSINSVAAYYITKNANGDQFATYAELAAATTFYSGWVVRVPTQNDYTLVASDETHDNATTRYSYQWTQWEYQYTVNETPLTQWQLDALNSGITSSKVSCYDGAVTTVNSLCTVATSGKYCDLSWTPTLCTVATSGKYCDLSWTPTIPTDNCQLSNSCGYTTCTGTLVASDLTPYAKSCDLKTVATSWKYCDLTGTPDLTVYQTKSNMVCNLSWADNSHYPSAKAVADALSSAGQWDMLKSVYDPNNVSADAFDYTNFINTPSLCTVATSGKYCDLTGKPTIPTDNCQLANSCGYITSAALSWYATTASLCTVATSWKYCDLTWKPTIPTDNCQLANSCWYTTCTGTLVASDLTPYAKSCTLCTVATTGKYCDLSWTPTIPAAQIQSDWTQTCNTCKDYIKNKPNLCTVATTGKYCDLTGKPTIPTNNNQLTNGCGYTTCTGTVVASDLTPYAKTCDLATVATSWKYCDLTWTPTIPTNNNQLTNWCWYTTCTGTVVASDLNAYAKSCTLCTVATTGKYCDLTWQPTIWSATLSICRNWTLVNSFSANATSNVSVDISVPTNTCELTNWAWFTTCTGTLTSANISDAAFWSSWDSDTTHAPSKNAIYDVLWDVETLLAAL